MRRNYFCVTNIWDSKTVRCLFKITLPLCGWFETWTRSFDVQCVIYVPFLPKALRTSYFLHGMSCVSISRKQTLRQSVLFSRFVRADPRTPVEGRGRKQISRGRSGLGCRTTSNGSCHGDQRWPIRAVIHCTALGWSGRAHIIQLLDTIHP